MRPHEEMGKVLDGTNITPSIINENLDLLSSEVSPQQKVCKYCQSSNILRKRRAGWEKTVLSLVNSYRYYCYNCGREFFAKRGI
jgi:DNA-directed RNA polymerase subunit RPC12/RpoP